MDFLLEIKFPFGHLFNYHRDMNLVKMTAHWIDVVSVRVERLRVTYLFPIISYIGEKVVRIQDSPIAGWLELVNAYPVIQRLESQRKSWVKDINVKARPATPLGIPSKWWTLYYTNALLTICCVGNKRTSASVKAQEYCFYRLKSYIRSPLPPMRWTQLT